MQHSCGVIKGKFAGVSMCSTNACNVMAVHWPAWCVSRSPSHIQAAAPTASTWHNGGSKKDTCGNMFMCVAHPRLNHGELGARDALPDRVHAAAAAGAALPEVHARRQHRVRGEEHQQAVRHALRPIHQRIAVRAQSVSGQPRRRTIREAGCASTGLPNLLPTESATQPVKVWPKLAQKTPCFSREKIARTLGPPCTRGCRGWRSCCSTPRRTGPPAPRPPTPAHQTVLAYTQNA